ncbi:pyridoxal kinase PdxY [Mesorhizobium xinjiangense]|uniref:pyridoxal kinase PdxY n=1 Tax=Mesorhizobium xinjiangense TaxID=2678685 RepID=UPI0012ECFAC4|nr:pyridoxal kinase PdxY [Mesorhizobium xinjiangense]
MVHPMPGRRPSVIAISSHVVRGCVGNRAVVFALETLGFPVWAVPTVTLSWHPGHGPSTMIVPDDEKFAAMLADLANAPWIGEVDAVISGYLGSPAQASAVAGLVEAVKSANPKVLYLCDPVMGDLGGLYVPEAIAASIRDALVPRADIATPNRHELAWMTGRRVETPAEVVDAAGSLGPQTVVVTSAPAGSSDATGNLAVTSDAAYFADHPIVARPPNGLGDLTAALLLGRLISGLALEAALGETTAAVYDILQATVARGGDELQIETDAALLAQPSSHIAVRELTLTGKPG